MRPPFSRIGFPRLVSVAATLAALPPLALTLYALGLRVGLVWFALAAFLVRLALRGAPSTWRARDAVLALWLPYLAVTLADGVRALSRPGGMSHDEAGLTLAVFTIVSACWLTAWIPFLKCLRACVVAQHRTFPHGETDLLTSAAWWSLWGAALLSIVSDEPLWWVDAAVMASAIALNAWALRRERERRGWLAKVAAGDSDAWQLQNRAQVKKTAFAHHAALVERVESLSSEVYRASATPTWALRAWVEAEESEGRWKLAPPRRRGDRAWHVVGIALCGIAAAWSHGYFAFSDQDRNLVIDRPTPTVVATRMQRHRSGLNRLGQFHVPGVDVWKDCSFPTCRGVAVAVDRGARVVDVPELMERVRDWPLEERVRLRFAMLARSGVGIPTAESIRAIQCENIVLADVLDVFSNRRFRFDFATGAWQTLNDRGPVTCAEAVITAHSQTRSLR